MFENVVTYFVGTLIEVPDLSFGGVFWRHKVHILSTVREAEHLCAENKGSFTENIFKQKINAHQCAQQFAQIFLDNCSVHRINVVGDVEGII